MFKLALFRFLRLIPGTDKKAAESIVDRFVDSKDDKPLLKKFMSVHYIGEKRAQAAVDYLVSLRDE